MNAAAPARPGFSGLQVTAIVFVAIALTVFAGWWVARTYIFPQPLAPVELSQSEELEVRQKLQRIGFDTEQLPGNGSEELRPEPYTERDADREVFFSEREVNGMLANDPELATAVALDLADDLVSFTLLVPVPEDFPIMPGRTLRVRGGAELAYRNGKPVVAVKGVSLMGVPLPNAWLGNLKNVDLVSQYGDAGFWQSFASGVEDMEVQQGRIRIKLRE